mmetsp:Transcript_8496/g.22358  ORF Transcript_8496/g.22358 Transcript_8496/m.22358 type:complete len:304 (-) Transcript_8496:876-1787(-)
MATSGCAMMWPRLALGRAPSLSARMLSERSAAPRISRSLATGRGRKGKQQPKKKKRGDVCGEDARTKETAPKNVRLRMLKYSEASLSDVLSRCPKYGIGARVSRREWLGIGADESYWTVTEIRWEKRSQSKRLKARKRSDSPDKLEHFGTSALKSSESTGAEEIQLHTRRLPPSALASLAPEFVAWGRLTWRGVHQQRAKPITLGNERDWALYMTQSDLAKRFRRNAAISTILSKWSASDAEAATYYDAVALRAERAIARKRSREQRLGRCADIQNRAPEARIEKHCLTNQPSNDPDAIDAAQ